MRVAVLQYPIVWADVEQNLSEWEIRLRQISGCADVAMLPEMFTTGFCTDCVELAEDFATSPTIAKLRCWAREFGMALFGSLMVSEFGRLYNRAFFVRPDGTADFADKRHLYAPGGEAEFFAAGQERKIVEYKGVKMCMLVCYDLRFPVWSRNVNGDDYDILLYTANWPEVRVKYWDALLPARAIENQCIVCAVNRVGDDGLGLHYNGHSSIIDTHLNHLVHFADDACQTQIADVDISEVRRFRQHSPLWKDTDRFSITV